MEMVLRIGRKDLDEFRDQNYIDILLRRKGLTVNVKSLKSWYVESVQRLCGRTKSTFSIIIENGEDWYEIRKVEVEFKGMRFEVFTETLRMYPIQEEWIGVLYVEIEKVSKQLFN